MTITIAIAERMPGPADRDTSGRCWWGAPDRSDPETGERYSADWSLREEPFYGCTEWAPAAAVPAAHFADENDTYQEAE